MHIKVRVKTGTKDETLRKVLIGHCCPQTYTPAKAGD